MDLHQLIQQKISNQKAVGHDGAAIVTYEELEDWMLKSEILKSSIKEWKILTTFMPPNNFEVMGYFPNGDESGEKVASAIYDGKRLYSAFPNSTAYCFEATHWMYYPEPPVN